ncbi:glutamine--fructose-6-phosphate transaminase (isomerizing) [Candidatus Schneideria nysicola]|uniref:glutamine--fructose-6-phosphate transaminase (isomerizing) n=1 Tax=Candidatus Schneideria nysicola TaxID=1081631 RepID=UPI001CAA759B|nr:glutamine--fructose-6-phosphate transaminase (isomerizing) [Candidatus Schneideria nysicola]UAJ65833.1 glutamine--fructose-6-phosphate transaminase (isomerizing) [Candidatus Schneideria nysicola]
MCGIVGAVSKRDIAQFLLAGLRRLEYRGYDSAGLATVDSKGKLNRLRRVGKVEVLMEAAKKYPIQGHIGIAHTRWATHGKLTEINAHPHISENIVVAHNGIIENYKFLYERLYRKGYRCMSETDTEIIAHLVHWEQKQRGGTLAEIILRIIPQLYGTYGIIIMDVHNSNVLTATCSGSPLVIGCGMDANFLASDPIALLPVAHRFVFIEEGDIIEVTHCTIKIWNKFGQSVNRPEVESFIKDDYDIESKGPYQHYMQKEIFEQPKVIKDTLKNRIIKGAIIFPEFGQSINKLLSKVKHIQIIACGTSYHSGMVSKYWFEELVRIPCDVEIASEFRYRKFVVRKDSLLIVLSQSGETADTLAALRITKNMGYLSSLAICNVDYSSLVRESDFCLLIKAGIEIGVASTKAFTNQLTVLLMLVIYIGQIKGMNSKIQSSIIHAITLLPDYIEQVFSIEKGIVNLSKNFIDKQHALFLGRGSLYPIAMEGALKLKEISYIHAEAYAAGELKHGPLALINMNIPVIVIVTKNNLLDKMKSNIEEILARGGNVYIFSEYNSGFIESDNIKIIPLFENIETIITPIVYTIPMQLLAYHIALVKKTDIDKPRNLAKSVTVE